MCGTILQLGPAYSDLVASFKSNQEWTSCWETHYQDSKDGEILREKSEKYMGKIMAFVDDDLSAIKDIRSPHTVAWDVTEGTRLDTSEQSYEMEYNKIFDGEQPPGRLQGPKLCIGTNHLIAMVPPSVEPGDVIVCFSNCKAAIVMRPFRTDGNYVLIGRTDVADDVRQTDVGAKVFVDLGFRCLQAITLYTSCAYTL